MTFREKFYTMLRLDEGVVYHVYKDSLGIETWGTGHNLRALPPDAVILVFNNLGKTPQEIDQILLDRATNAIVVDITAKLSWYTSLTEVRQLVILDMAFNMGVNGLWTFVNTLEHIRLGHYDLAAAGMRDSKWYTQVGNRAERLAYMMQKGEMHPDYVKAGVK